jgi:hypothetical protein
MANKASAAAVQADMQPPNYRAAVQQIRSTKAKKDKVSGINGEIGAVYAKVEGFKVNKRAGKIFYALDNMTPEDRVDVLRSLNGLCDAAGWAETTEDLVDQANGNVVHMRVGPKADTDDDADLDEALAAESERDDLDEALADEFSEATAEELAKQAGRADQKARAREQLDAAPKPKKASISSIASPEPYTGDNSDLVGDGDAA